jgi:hypothetical protein
VLESIDAAQYIAYQRTGQWTDTLSVLLVSIGIHYGMQTVAARCCADRAQTRVR